VRCDSDGATHHMSPRTAATRRGGILLRYAVDIRVTRRAETRHRGLACWYPAIASGGDMRRGTGSEANRHGRMEQLAGGDPA